MCEKVKLKRIKLILWVLFAAACSLPFWWPLAAEPAVLPHYIPFYKLWHFDRFGLIAFLNDLLYWLLPLVPAGAFLALLGRKTRLYMAMLLGLALGFGSLLTVGGAFVTDAGVYGLIGCTLGFSAVTAVQKGRDSVTRIEAAAFFVACYVSIALLMIFGGGSRFGRLHFTSSSELPKDVYISGELSVDRGSVPVYVVDNPYGLESLFDVRSNVEPVDYSFEQWDTLGRRELGTMGDLLPEIYALEAVQELSWGYRLNYSTAVDTHLVSGYEVVLDYDLCGTPLSIRSPITGFSPFGSAEIFDAGTTLERIQSGEAGFTLLCKGSPASLTVSSAALAYRDDSTTGCLLPFWTFYGTAAQSDGSTIDFILYAEAMK